MINDATELHCPNCGAGLGALQGGEYVCAYCGHHSLPPEAPLDQARQDELVARAIAKYQETKDARFARERAAAEESAARGRAADEAARKRGGRIGWWIQVVVFAGSSLWMLSCFGVATGWALSGYLPDSIVRSLPSWTSGGGKVGPATNVVLCLFVGIVLPLSWPAEGLLLGLREKQRERRLRTRGVRGRAVVLSYRRRDELRGEAVVRVELPGRPGYKVSLKRDVSVGGPGWAFVNRKPLLAGIELPVVVDPRHPKDVVVDWDTALEMTLSESGVAVS